MQAELKQTEHGLFLKRRVFKLIVKLYLRKFETIY